MLEKTKITKSMTNQCYLTYNKSTQNDPKGISMGEGGPLSPTQATIYIHHFEYQYIKHKNNSNHDRIKSNTKYLVDILETNTEPNY